MTIKVLKEVIERAESWPDDAQAELAAIAFEIDAIVRGGVYQPTQGEFEGMDRGLRAAREGRFATDAEVKAVFAKHRRGSKLRASNDDKR